MLGPGSAPGDALAPGFDFARDFFGFPVVACTAASACTGPSAVTLEGDGVVDGAAFLELDRVLFRVGDCASLAPVSEVVAGASTGAVTACCAPAAFLRGLRVVGEGFAVSGSSVEGSSLDAADFVAALAFACFLAVRLFLVAVFLAACGDEPVGSGGAGTGSTGAVDGAASGADPLLEVVPRFGRREGPGGFVEDEVGPSDGEDEPDGPPPGPEPGAEGVPPPPPGGAPPPPGGFGREDKG